MTNQYLVTAHLFTVGGMIGVSGDRLEVTSTLSAVVLGWMHGGVTKTVTTPCSNLWRDINIKNMSLVQKRYFVE